MSREVVLREVIFIMKLNTARQKLILTLKPLSSLVANSLPLLWPGKQKGVLRRLYSLQTPSYFCLVEIIIF